MMKKNLLQYVNAQDLKAFGLDSGITGTFAGGYLPQSAGCRNAEGHPHRT